eukprot:jgi/Psemu1/44142/gm1.44142_g
MLVGDMSLNMACQIEVSLVVVGGHKRAVGNAQQWQLKSNATEEKKWISKSFIDELDNRQNNNVDADPTTIAFLELEHRNQLAVKMLIDSGSNGGVDSQLALRIMLKNTLATKQPNIRACQDAFLDIHPKKEAAQPLIDNCDGNLFIDLPVSEMRKVFEWKLQEKITRLNKDVMEAENKDPPEAELIRLIEEDIQIKHTELWKAMSKDLIQLVLLELERLVLYKALQQSKIPQLEQAVFPLQTLKHSTYRRKHRQTGMSDK